MCSPGAKLRGGLLCSYRGVNPSVVLDTSTGLLWVDGAEFSWGPPEYNPDQVYRRKPEPLSAGDCVRFEVEMGDFVGCGERAKLAFGPDEDGRRESECRVVISVNCVGHSVLELPYDTRNSNGYPFCVGSFVACAESGGEGPITTVVADGWEGK